MILDWVKLIGGLVILIGAGEFLVRSSVRLALLMRVSSMVIGLTVVSFGTSFPELVVSLNAALEGHPDIAVGNVVGSNIANLALVLGLCALFFPMAVQRSTVVFDWPIMLVSTIALILFSLDLKIVWWEGVVFFIGIIVYNVVLIRASRKSNDPDLDLELPEELDKRVKMSSAQLIRTGLLFVGSLVALIVGADILVDGAVGVARTLGMEERVIGLTIVAFGTSTPELATSLIALYKKENALSIGNLIGSNIFNILGILGLTAVIHPIDIHPQILSFDYFWVLGIPLLLYPFLLTRLKVTSIEGAFLVATYIAYLVLLF